MSELTLTDRLHDVATARRKLALLREAEIEARNVAVEEPVYKAWMDAENRRRAYEGEVALAEQVAREQAVYEVGLTGNMRPAEGITVKRFTVLRYDLSAATAWCRGIMPGLLTLDTKRFERMAREDMLPGAPVEIVSEPRAQLAADLSQYIE